MFGGNGAIVGTWASEGVFHEMNGKVVVCRTFGDEDPPARASLLSEAIVAEAVRGNEVQGRDVIAHGRTFEQSNGVLEFTAPAQPTLEAAVNGNTLSQASSIKYLLRK